MTIFGASSLHPKIPFPAAVVEREVRPQLKPYSGFCAAVIRNLGPALQLFRIEPERLKLPAPFSRRIAEPLDAGGAGQTQSFTREIFPFRLHFGKSRLESVQGQQRGG